MGEKGTKIDVSYTQFFDWVPVGDDDRGFDYGGKLDVRVQSNLSKLLWEGFSVAGHVEMRYGDVPLLAGGTLIPTSTALLFPESSKAHTPRSAASTARKSSRTSSSCSSAGSTRSTSTARTRSRAAVASTGS